MSAEFTVRERDEVTIVDGKGKITTAGGAGTLRNIIMKLHEEGKVHLILNLAEITYIDSSGLGQIVSGFSRITGSGGELKLLKLTGRVRGFLQTTKLSSIFEIFEDEDLAVKSFFEKHDTASV
jgi:anti-sigma B factor antagonist